MGFGQGDIDDLLKEAGLGGGSGGGVDDILGSAGKPARQASPGGDFSNAHPASFQSFDESSHSSGHAADIEDLLGDVQLKVQVVLGNAKMSVEEILQLANGSVVELDKLAGDPLDILVNDRLVAKGEVLVLNENFCIRITDIIPPSERS